MLKSKLDVTNMSVSRSPRRALAQARRQDWVEEELIMHALPWTQERWIGSVLQSFSPTLTYRSDGRGGAVWGRCPKRWDRVVVLGEWLVDSRYLDEVGGFLKQ